MAQQNSTTEIPSAGADYDAVVAQVAALRDEISKLSGTASEVPDLGHALVADVSEGMAEAGHFLVRQARDGEARLSGAVGTHPYVALGLAAGVGLLLGALTRRWTMSPR